MKPKNNPQNTEYPLVSEEIFVSKDSLKKYTRINKKYVYSSNGYSSLQLDIFYLAMNALKSGKWDNPGTIEGNYTDDTDPVTVNEVNFRENCFNDAVIYIPVSALATNNFKHIAAACEGLLCSGFKYIDPEKGEYESISPFIAARYYSSQRYIKLQIAASMRYDLTNITNGFSKPDQSSILNMKSKVFKKLYALICTQRKSRKLMIKEDNLKFILDVKDKYKELKYFNRDVMEAGITEIGNKTDLVCSWKFEKCKKTSETVFYISIDAFKGEGISEEAKKEADAEIYRFFNLPDQERTKQLSLYLEAYKFDLYSRLAIMNSNDLIKKFVDVHCRIQSGSLQVKLSDTAYMLKTLGLI